MLRWDFQRVVLHEIFDLLFNRIPPHNGKNVAEGILVSKRMRALPARCESMRCRTMEAGFLDDAGPDGGPVSITLL